MKQSILLLIATLLFTTAFQTGSISSRSRATANGALFSAVADEQETAVKSDLLKRDRYVATNRFTVRPGRAAKFEKRWGEYIYYLHHLFVHVASFLIFRFQPIALPGWLN